MRIAILGGGFAGLSVAWYLLHYSQGQCAIDLFDPEPIGAGASGLASGLLHPYAGKHAKLNWQAEQSLKEAHRLLTVSAQALGMPLILSKGILRPALTEEQIADFKKTASLHPDTQWWDKKQCEKAFPEMVLPEEGGALFISEGLTIDVKSYLQGLWQASALHGTMHHHLTRITAEKLAAYDRVVVAMGVLSRNFPPLKDLPLNPIKGQVIQLKWPEELPPLPMSLVSQKYIVMSPDLKSCIVGATFERHFTGHHPEPEVAQKEILPHIHAFYPKLNNAPILSVKAAFRGSTPNHLPIVGKFAKNAYFFAGLGSKGLLYHAFVGKCVARALLKDDLRYLPEKLICTL